MALKCKSQKLNLGKKTCLKLVRYSTEVICVRCPDMPADHPVCMGLKTALDISNAETDYI